MAVYKGFKKKFPNYSLFSVDMSKPYVKEIHNGTGETVDVLLLAPKGKYSKRTGIYGWKFPLGSTGLYSFGNGEWLICKSFRTDEGHCGEIRHYKWNETAPFVEKTAKP